jgi:hypothetical protein
VCYLIVVSLLQGKTLFAVRNKNSIQFNSTICYLCAEPTATISQLLLLLPNPSNRTSLAITEPLTEMSTGDRNKSVSGD